MAALPPALNLEAMQLSNRVAAGTELQGDLFFEGGLLVEGSLAGKLQVNGRLVLAEGGRLRGRVRVAGDAYLYGEVGSEEGGPVDTQFEAQGTVTVGPGGITWGSLKARRLQVMPGGQTCGPVRSTVNLDQLPVLRDALPPAGSA